MSRTYYCNDCLKTIEFQNDENHICKCGHMFGVKINDTRRDPAINMRNTWSGTTQVEFSQTTIDKDIAERNAR
jgi:DNA-directed RNA polymerase subunit RPC12/RpoP